MKKIIFILTGIINSRNGFYLLCLIFSLFIQSCSTLEKEMQASPDANKQRFSGPSYSKSSDDESGVGFNIAFIWLYGSMKGNSRHLGHAFNNVDLGNFRSLYASNSHGPSVFYNSSENDDVETAKLNKEKVSPSFMNNLRYTGGIEFIQKNSKDGSTKITLDYLQVPLYALYQFQPSSSGNFFGGLGPYFAYGIGGSMKTTYNGQTTKSKSFDKTTGYKPFDAGLSLTAGYKITNSFSFSLAYDYGLVNIDRNAFGDKTKNRGISLNVRYPLNKIIKK